MSIFCRWNSWQDVGIEYIQHEYKWVVIQTRTRKKDNLRQIRHVLIMRYGGGLNKENKEALNRIIDNREKLNP